MNETRVDGVDASVVGHEVTFDAYVPLQVRSYAQPLGAGVVRLGDYARTLLELTVECNSNRLRGVTLTSVLRLDDWPLVCVGRAQAGSPVLGTALEQRRVISLAQDFKVAVGEAGILIFWAPLDACEACDCGRVRYLVADGRLAGIWCTRVTREELQLFHTAAEAGQGATTADRLEVLREIEMFVELQRALVTAFRAQDGMADGDLDVWAAGGTGTVGLGADVWDFRRHGGGVAFQQRGSGLLVDVHVSIDDPGVFDHWRLRSYFGSLQQRGRSLLDRATRTSGLTMDDALTMVLDDLVLAGRILRRQDALRLPESDLLAQFLAEECTETVRGLIDEAIAQSAGRRSHLAFNRFEVTIEDDVVLLADVLDATPTGLQRIELSAFVAGLGRARQTHGGPDDDDTNR